MLWVFWLLPPFKPIVCLTKYVYIAYRWSIKLKIKYYFFFRCSNLSFSSLLKVCSLLWHLNASFVFVWFLDMFVKTVLVFFYLFEPFVGFFNAYNYCYYYYYRVHLLWNRSTRPVLWAIFYYVKRLYKIEKTAAFKLHSVLTSHSSFPSFPQWLNKYLN